MKLVFAILALVALCKGTSIGSKIVQGTDAKEGEIPYQISIQSVITDMHYCGGSIINEHYVVTAAHCVIGDEPSNIKIVAGTVNLLLPQSVHYVEKVIVHKGYNTKHSYVNDIALVKVSTPFMFSPTISPVNMPARSAQPKTNAVAVISGWGTLWPGGPSPDILQRTEVAIADQDYCNATNSAFGLPVYEHQICAYRVDKLTGPCHGDSGGPLTVDGTLVGIASWVISCASRKYPTVYTRVPDYIDWLNKYAV